MSQVHPPKNETEVFWQPSNSNRGTETPNNQKRKEMHIQKQPLEPPNNANTERNGAPRTTVGHKERSAPPGSTNKTPKTGLDSNAPLWGFAAPALLKAKDRKGKSNKKGSTFQEHVNVALLCGFPASTQDDKHQHKF